LKVLFVDSGQGPVHWQTARVTVVSVGQSPGVGARPESHTDAGHFCADWMSRACPALKPLPRQAAFAAVRQSGAPFAAAPQR
jgi:hypothetical protein